MRSLVLGLVLSGFVGTAAAGDTYADARYADGNDYSAKLFYAVDFGGTQPGSQSMGLRFDNERAASRGAPALFKASFDGQGTPTVRLQGVDVMGTMKLGAMEGFSAAQIGGLVFTGIIFAAIVVEAADSDDEVTTVSGTGGG
jgi:hypothetical protein